MYLEFVID